MSISTYLLLTGFLLPSLSGREFLPVLDLSADTARHVIVAQGTKDIYNGQPTTALMPDGKTIYCVWTYGHGGKCGPMKRSDDGGRTWASQPVPSNWITKNAYVAWVGTYDDIIHHKPGQYRIKLLHSYKTWDCGYSGIELLPDQTFVATTYIKYRPGEDKNSVVSTRFSLQETDNMVAARSQQ